MGRLAMAAGGGKGSHAAFELLNLALERGWSLGILLVLFSGAILIAPWSGLRVPSLLEEWAGAGLLFGGSVVVLSLLSQIADAVARAVRREGLRRKYARGSADDAIRNLSSLLPDELRVFHELLIGAPPRFEVHRLSAAHPLIDKGVLVPVRKLSGSNWICEIHPAILAMKQQILPPLEKALKDQANHGF
jgi:hypothetical protein